MAWFGSFKERRDRTFDAAVQEAERLRLGWTAERSRATLRGSAEALPAEYGSSGQPQHDPMLVWTRNAGLAIEAHLDLSNRVILVEVRDSLFDRRMVVAP
jgi:hypothetical protein